MSFNQLLDEHMVPLLACGIGFARDGFFLPVRSDVVFFRAKFLVFMRRRREPRWNAHRKICDVSRQLGVDAFK